MSPVIYPSFPLTLSLAGRDTAHTSHSFGADFVPTTVSTLRGPGTVEIDSRQGRRRTLERGVDPRSAVPDAGATNLTRKARTVKPANAVVDNNPTDI